MKQPRSQSSKNGFERASSLMQTRIRAVSEKRGFAVTRLLTHWHEIVGEDIAQITQPVSVSYAKGGFGATLTVLTTGAQAPMLEMQKNRICDKVNACYGYRAISRVRITQTAPTGFAEGRIGFAAAPAPEPALDEPTQQIARAAAQGIENTELRLALETLAGNVLRKRPG